MKRGIQGVSQRKQPKQPITISVAADTIGQLLHKSQRYILFLSKIYGELSGECGACREAGPDSGGL
jgi:hypothetical protein